MSIQTICSSYFGIFLFLIINFLMLIVLLVVENKKPNFDISNIYYVLIITSIVVSSIAAQKVYKIEPKKEIIKEYDLVLMEGNYIYANTNEKGGYNYKYILNENPLEIKFTYNIMYISEDQKPIVSYYKLVYDNKLLNFIASVYCNIDSVIITPTKYVNYN